MSSDPFVADAALRLIAPGAPGRSRVRLAAAIVVALGLELAVFALFWFERSYAPPPEPEAVPVEIVVEPPPPPPPPPEAKPAEEKPQAQDYEKPATDAPRDGKADHDDETVAEKEKPAAAPPPVATPEPTPEAPKPEPTPEAAKPEPTPEAAKAEPTPELTPEPTAEPAEAPKPEPPAEAPPPEPSVASILSSLNDTVPDVDFGGAARKSPIGGGKAEATYLAMLVGYTRPYVRIPPEARTYGRTLVGRLEVTLDGRGRLVQRTVMQSSGSSQLDEAAMRAVAEASRHFPRPPGGRPIGLFYTYTSGD